MYWYELLFLWTQCYVFLTVLNVCTSIGWIIFSHSYLHATHDEIYVCLAIWLIWWTNIFVIKMINTPGHVLSPGWPLCKRSGLSLIEVSQHAYSSYQAFSLPFIFYHVIFATWCNWLDFYWCWIKLCLSLSLRMCIVYLFLNPLRCIGKTCLYLYITSTVKTMPSICRDGFDLVRWILARCPVVIQAIDMHGNITSRLVVIYWDSPTWSRMIAGFTTVIFVFRGINWTTCQHVVCSTEYVNPCLDKTRFYFSGGLAELGEISSVMPQSHIILPPYARRTVLWYTVCKMRFLKIVRSCGLR